MRIVFVGTVEFSRRALERLVEIDADIAGVCTLRDSAFNADHCDLSHVCEAHGIPWVYAPDINSEETLQWINDRQPEIVFCFGWSKLLRTRLLHLAPMGVVGFHPAALPANRGRHPIIWALALGLRETASTFFFMDEGADSGDILSQVAIPIDEGDDAAALYDKITTCALSQISSFVPQLAAGSVHRMAQEHSQANTWRKRTKADGQIDWRMSARNIHNLVRALSNPYVGAHFLYRNEEIKVWRTELVLDVPQNVEPGKVLEVTNEGVVVRCGEQGIRLSKTDPMFMPAIGEYL